MTITSRHRDLLLACGLLLAGCRSASHGLRWRRSLDSVGAVPYSGVGLCVNAESVFITAASRYAPGAQPPPGRLVALRRSDGSLRWATPVGIANLSIPVLTQARLIVADFRDRLYAFEPASGQQVWQRDLASYGSMMGVNQQEIASGGGLLYVRCPLARTREMMLVCLSEGNGSTVWELRSPWGQIAVSADNVVYIGSQHLLSSIDGRTGKVIQSINLFPDRVLALSSIGNDVLCATASSLVRFAGRPLRKQWHTALQGTTATEARQPILRCEHVILANADHVYVWLDNRMWAVDATSGQLVWQREWRHNIAPCLVSLDGGMIAVGYYTDGLAQVETLDASSGRPMHQLSLADVRHGYRTLAIFGSRIYIVTMKEIQCYQA